MVQWGNPVRDRKAEAAICLIVYSIETKAFQAAARQFFDGGFEIPSGKCTVTHPRFIETNASEKIIGFYAIAKKHGVKYQLMKEAGKENPRYAVFLRSARKSSINLALEEYIKTEYPRGEGEEWDLRAELEQCKKEAAAQKGGGGN